MIIFRSLKIIGAVFTHGLDQLLLKNAPSKLFKGSLSSQEISENAIKFCLNLGPIFIKMGQIISTRPDIFTPELAQALEKLQDQVPQNPLHEIQKIIDQSLPQHRFSNIQPTALGSGSIAQVHEATLDGKQVVIKILRPHIQQQLKRDIRAISFLSSLLLLVRPRFHKLQIKSFIHEFHVSLSNEIDLRQEASNYQTMALNFKGDPSLYVPKVYDEFTRSNTLVLEKITAKKITDLPLDPSINRKKLAENGVKIFFTQVLRDRFFHADMHPGNIFVNIEDPNQPQYIAIDFGIVGVLSPEDTDYLARNLQAFFKRDYYEIARLHLESQWVEGHIRTDLFEQAIRTVCEPIYAKPIGEISFAVLLEKLINIAEKFELIPQPQLLLLQKTLLNVEGLGRRLYPQLNLWETALPLLDQHFSPYQNVQNKLKSLPARLSQFEKNVDRYLNRPQHQPRDNWSISARMTLNASILLNAYLLWRLWG